MYSVAFGWIRPWRPILLAVIPATLFLGCGGGGDDDEDDEEAPVVLLSEYNYAITNSAGAPAPFERSQLTNGAVTDAYRVNAGAGSIRGRYVRSSGSFTIATSTTYSVDWNVGGPSPGQFSVSFTEQASLPRSNFQPGSGAYTVSWNGNTIRVAYGASTTEVSLNGAAPIAFAPVDFANLRNSTSAAPDWQRVASLASGALVDVLRRAAAVAALLEVIHDGGLDSGQAVAACTEFPGAPPPGIGQRGEVVATNLGGDNFRSTANDCFSRGAGQPIGVLGTGTVDYRNLVLTESGSSVTRAGFEGTAARSGGVTYNLRERFVREAAPMVWQFENFESRLAGGFSLVFSAT